MQQSLDHPNIVKIYEVFVKKKKLFIYFSTTTITINQTNTLSIHFLFKK